MKNRVFIFVLILSIPFYNSCNKREYLKPDGEFIEAKFGNEILRYTSTKYFFTSNFYNHDTIEFVPHDLYLIQDNLQFVRLSDNGEKTMGIHILESALTPDQVPIDLPHNDSTSVELQWIDITQQNSNIFDSSNEGFYKGAVQLTMESWDDNNYLEGTFYGDIATDGGDTISVTNGKFRIQIFY